MNEELKTMIRNTPNIYLGDVAEFVLNEFVMRGQDMNWETKDVLGAKFGLVDISNDEELEMFGLQKIL